MDGAWAVCIQHLIVELGAIALVFGKLVLGIDLRHLQHIPVTADFSQNRGRRNGYILFRFCSLLQFNLFASLHQGPFDQGFIAELICQSLMTFRNFLQQIFQRSCMAPCQQPVQIAETGI